MAPIGLRRAQRVDGRSGVGPGAVGLARRGTPSRTSAGRSRAHGRRARARASSTGRNGCWSPRRGSRQPDWSPDGSADRVALGTAPDTLQRTGRRPAHSRDGAAEPVVVAGRHADRVRAQRGHLDTRGRTGQSSPTSREARPANDEPAWQTGGVRRLREATGRARSSAPRATSSSAATTTTSSTTSAARTPSCGLARRRRRLRRRRERPDRGRGGCRPNLRPAGREHGLGGPGRRLHQRRAGFYAERVR